MTPSARQGLRDRRLLSIDEVRAAGRPAVFSAYGDYLAFVDGAIYALPREPEACELAALPSLLGAYEVTNVVGIEYGWYQLDDGSPAADKETS